jgi:hypothetical protein
MPLGGIDVFQSVIAHFNVIFLYLSAGFSIAAGQNSTLILAKPNQKLSDLPRHPVDVQPPMLCVKCNKDNGEDDPPLECDKVCVNFFMLIILSCPNRIATSAMLHAISGVLTFPWTLFQKVNGSALNVPLILGLQ